MASLENTYLNLDDPPTLVKPCPEDWSETMHALNEDVQQVPYDLVSHWAPVVAQWQVFETTASTHKCIRVSLATEHRILPSLTGI